MTENEAMERMRSLIAQAVQERQAESWTTVAARTALTSHPAVDALREIVAFETDMERRGCPSSVGLVWFEKARTVLASLPKEK